MIGVDAVVGGFPVHALVKGIDDDHGGYFGFCQRPNDDVFDPGTKRFRPTSGLAFKPLSSRSRNSGYW